MTTPLEHIAEQVRTLALSPDLLPPAPDGSIAAGIADLAMGYRLQALRTAVYRRLPTAIVDMDGFTFEADHSQNGEPDWALPFYVAVFAPGIDAYALCDAGQGDINQLADFMHSQLAEGFPEDLRQPKPPGFDWSKVRIL